MAVKTRRVQLALLVVLLAVLAFLVWTTSATVRTLFQPRIDLPAPVPNAELPLPTQAAHLFWSGRYEAFEQLLDTSLAKTAAPDEIERVLSDTCDNRSAGKGEAERWLTRMPNRSWPQLCLGRALVQSALAARGKELSVNTTPEKFRRMHVLFDDAAARLIPFYGDDRYRRAVTIPLLTLIQFSGASALANIGSYDAVYERTHSAFPGMQSLYWHRIENLRPQWGGSLKAMQAFAAEAKVRGATAKTTEQLEALVTTTATAEQWRGNPQQPLARREAHIALPLSVDGFEILASDLT